jgi:tetratricopeptide (TPR) repeat protein
VHLEKWSEAVQPLREYCVNQPGHREATLALGKALAMKGEHENAVAIAEEYCRKYPRDAYALTQMGIIYLESGRTEDAWRVCNQAMKESPEGMDSLFFNAALLMFDGRYAEARDAYERLLQLQQPNPNPELLVLLAHACRQAAEHDASIAYGRAALKLNPRSIPALGVLSTGLLSSDTAEARRLMDQAAAIAPNSPMVLAMKGQLLEFEGDKQGAWEHVRAAIDGGLNDSHLAAIAATVAPDVGKIEEAIEILERLAERPGLPVSERKLLHFSLAAICDKDKQYDRAFGHAVIANRMKNALHNHNRHMAALNRSKTVYGKTTIDTLPRSRVRSELPVFIVGMPRSGTSLLEQILSCHSKVHACGETYDVQNLVSMIPYYPDGARNLTQEQLDSMAETYIRRLRELAPTAIRVTDKMPSNYMHAGLISQIFPGARILNCRRDPRDVCLSNFLIEFRVGHVFTYDLESLAKVCKAYQELMEHWKAVLPIPILDVRYEELIADPRTWVGKVLEFCGLEWEEACLDFHRSKRQVNTASYDQVRRPLYTKSVARWKNYAQHLEPVSRILDLHGDSYP